MILLFAAQKLASHAEKASSGLPQFRFGFWPGQVFWTLIIFGVLYTCLSQIFLPKVRSAFDTRADRIANDMKEARLLQEKAQAEAALMSAETLKAKAAAQALVLASRSKVAENLKDRQNKLEAELHKKIAAAEAEISERSRLAMTEVKTIAEDALASLIKTLLGIIPAKNVLSKALDQVGQQEGK